MRNNNFDFLRFFFAFIVLLVHLSILSGIKEIEFIRHYLSSYISVTAFFIISGYLIAKSYVETSNLSRYFLKRAARLLPAYVFVIMASAMFLSVISSQSLSEYFSNSQFYRYLFANLTFQNYLQPCLPGVFDSNVFGCDVNGALWTLKIEVAFYLTLPFVIYFGNKLKNKFVFFISIYLLSILYKLGFEYIGEKYQLHQLTFLSRQLPGFYSYFISGVMIYYLKKPFLENKNKLVIIAFIAFLTERHFGSEIFTPMSLSVLVFYVAFSFRWLNNFAKFGDISYGVYIYHYPIINMAVYFGLFNSLNVIISSSIVVLIIILISFISWHLLEKPFLQKVRRC